MTLHRPLWMQPAEGDDAFAYTGLLMRLGITGTWASEGVTAPANFKVTQRAAGANMSVDVAGGIAVVTGNDVALQGTYMCISDAVENVTVPAPPASGSRTHRIILWVKDKLYDGTLPANTYAFTVELQEDTGSGTPDQPDSAISLATVTVAAGQVSVTNANIADTRISALTTPSWSRQVASASDRPVIPLPGERIWRTDLGCAEEHDGLEWREVPHRGGGGSAWSTYTPSWTSSGTNPAIGNGKRVGRYDRVGRTVNVNAKIITGSSTTYGSGTYLIGLPVPALTDDDGQVLMCEVRDVSTGEIYQGHARITDPTTASLRVQGTAEDMNVVTQGVPVTFGAGDIIRIFGTYEAAS